MVTLETNKQKLKIINQTTPIQNLLFRKFKRSHNLIMDFVGWTHHYPQVDINRLSSKTKQFTKIVGVPSLGVKILGSEYRKNHIWIFNIKSNFYVFFLSIQGLSIETLPKANPDQVVKDLKLIKSYLKLKSYPK